MPFGEKKWIMVVEDDVDLRASLVLSLQNYGYPTLGFSNGLEALRILADKTKHLPCVMVLNLNMPVMSGTELLHVIQISERLIGIPIIIASGEVTIPTNGHYKILRKPYTVQEVIDLVKECGMAPLNHVLEPKL